MYDYKAANEDEMSFSKGQLISVFDKNDPDWWKGEVNGVTGLFPTNYVKMTTADTDPSQQCEYITFLMCFSKVVISQIIVSQFKCSHDKVGR